MKKLNDNQLIDLYILGDEYAFNVLLRRHKNYVFQFIHSKIKNVDISNDIFQDTFIKVIVCFKNKTYKENGKFLSWVLRIANNLVMDHYRNIERKPIFKQKGDWSLFENFPDAPSVLEDMMAIEYNFFKIKTLIEKILAPEQLQVLKLRFEEDKSFKEIAEITGVNINTALGRFRYAIDNIRKEIKSKKILLIR